MSNKEGITSPGSGNPKNRDGDFTTLLKIKKSSEAFLERLLEKYPKGSPK
jgi:hypothetical protein